MKPLESLEQGLRHLFEQLGAKIDSLVGGNAQKGASVRSMLTDLVPTLQRAIDSNVQKDEQNNSCLAPHRLRILFDYDTYSKFNQPGLRLLRQELAVYAEQYINDRRYRLSQPLSLTLTYDPLASSLVVRADFGEADRPQLAAPTGAKNPLSTYRLRSVTQPAVIIDLKDLKKGGNPLSIGRAGDNTISLDDKSISKFHATLAIDSDGNIILADCGSTNGTFLNEKAVSGRQVVTPGDLLGFGDVRLRLETVE
jgi:hypothetical protein